MLIAREPEATIRARALELGLLTPFAVDARAKIADGLTTAEEIDRVLPGLE
jgi:type II secretory ATPase GspE/PulE/Tfp pilus assembly ATPase PilB-like protein